MKTSVPRLDFGSAAGLKRGQPLVDHLLVGVEVGQALGEQGLGQGPADAGGGPDIAIARAGDVRRRVGLAEELLVDDLDGPDEKVRGVFFTLLSRFPTDEEILAELRNCPPAPGFERVEVPGERERDRRAEAAGKPISLPTTTWEEIRKLVAALGLDIQAP